MIPIIMQSAYTIPKDHDLRINAGANNFVSKAISAEKRLTLISKYLEYSF